MTDVFDPTAAEEFIKRIRALTPQSPPLWAGYVERTARLGRGHFEGRDYPNFGPLSDKLAFQRQGVEQPLRQAPGPSPAAVRGVGSSPASGVGDGGSGTLQNPGADPVTLQVIG